MIPPEEGVNDERSVVTILTGLWDKSERLVRQELALGLAELDRRSEEAADRLKRAATGGAVLFAGALALLGAGVLLLGQYIALWLAATIWGVVVSGIGYAMMKSAEPRRDVGVRAAENLIEGRHNINTSEVTHDAT